MRRSISLFVALVVLSATLLTACDDIGMDDLSYAPDTYGENGHCYYAYDPAEVLALQRAGLCPRTWTPVIMPVIWHSTYYMYYDSPSYYDHYIPVQRRTDYRTTATKFETEHQTEITRYSNSGKWKGSDGKKYSGKTVTTKVKTKTTSTTAKSKTTTTRSRTTTTTRSSSRVSSRR